MSLSLVSQFELDIELIASIGKFKISFLPKTFSNMKIFYLISMLISTNIIFGSFSNKISFENINNIKHSMKPKKWKH